MVSYFSVGFVNHVYPQKGFNFSANIRDCGFLLLNTKWIFSRSPVTETSRSD